MSGDMGTPDEKLSAKQKLFIEWLCAPKGVRTPSTQAEWGRENQVGVTTIGRWKSNAVFREAWDRRLAELQVDPENLGEVLAALGDKAKAGDTKAISMYLDIAWRFRPPPEPEAPKVVTSPSELSDDELQALLEIEAERIARASDAP